MSSKHSNNKTGNHGGKKTTMDALFASLHLEPRFRNERLVQVRKLDDSLASSPEEWKSRGYKLLHEENFEMATICFERANDSYGEKLAKALGLKAHAELLYGSNPEMSSIVRRQAAEFFDSIDKAEQAAECFYILKEYEKAGQTYLKCGESALEKAANCFFLAESYMIAAEIYAQVPNISKCLFACTRGKLFGEGLNYLQCWKDDQEIVQRCKDLEKLEQKFWENCARHVYFFGSMKLKRRFLWSIGCYDELLSLVDEKDNLKAVFSLCTLIEMPKADAQTYIKAILSVCTFVRSDRDIDWKDEDLGNIHKVIDILMYAEHIEDKETLFSRAPTARAVIQHYLLNLPYEVGTALSEHVNPVGRRTIINLLDFLLRMKQLHDLLEPDKLELEENIFSRTKSLCKEMKPGWRKMNAFLGSRDGQLSETRVEENRPSTSKGKNRRKKI